MNLSLIFLVLASVTVIHAGPDDWADCSSLPSGVTLVDCPTPQPSQAMPLGGGGPGGLPPFSYELLDCCVSKTYSGVGPKGYKFFGGHYELVIESVGLAAGAKLYIKNVRCKNNGACKQYVIDSTATFPLTLPMSSGHFKFSSEKSFSVTFSTTNQPKTGCRCCSTGWDQFKVSCYRRSTIEDGFNEVENNCKSLHADAHLASIHSPEENDFVVAQYYPGEEYLGMWIGLHDTGLGAIHPRPWEYTDGSPYDYQNWNPGEPNNSTGNDDCAHIWDADHDFEWNDIWCTFEAFGVCKYNIF